MTGTPDFGNIIDDFVIEAGEGLDMAVDDVLSLEQGPDLEAIGRIFRVVHTIKGTAGMLGFDALARFVHGLEDACSDIRSGARSVDRQAADNLLGCLDLTRAKLDFIGKNRREDGDFTRGEACLSALRPGHEPSAPVREEACLRAWSGTVDKVLIVEDDFVSRKMAHSFLSRFSDCYVAKDGSEAIQAVTESYLGAAPEPFSLIVMDVMMPIIDGIRATRAIRALERSKGAGHTHPAARICISSARCDEETRRAAIRSGADAFLPKPLDFKELRRLLERDAQPPADRAAAHPRQNPLPGTRV